MIAPQSLRGVFVVGTDTSVGKTQVARALLTLMAQAGLRPLALKPVETGCAPDAPEDALALRAACGAPGDSLSLDRVCPYRFRMPAAPLVAGDAEHRQVDLDHVLRLARQGSAEGPLVVEAAGGLQVPLSRESSLAITPPPIDSRRAPSRYLVTNLDLAERLGLPVVLVGRAGLGTLNHCALSAEVLERRKLDLLAIVLNEVTPPGDDPTVASNAAVLAELTFATVLGPLPFVADGAARPAALASLLEPLLRKLLPSLRPH